jgi:uncharacterized coiled-coil DUF342 family protein
MTNEQLYLAIGVPIVFNALIALLLNARISDLGKRIDDMRLRIDDMRSEFRELLAAERRVWDANFRHVLDKLEELDTRLARLEAK